MKKLFLLFSHKLTKKQEEEAKEQLSVDACIHLPEKLQVLWSSVSPAGELNIENLKIISGWMQNNSKKGDFVLVQGEYGATFFVVDFCFKNHLIPIYATSKRVYEEVKNTDGSIVRKHLFKHVNFRKYIKYERKE